MTRRHSRLVLGTVAIGCMSISACSAASRSATPTTTTVITTTTSTTSTTSTTTVATGQPSLPSPDHIVVVIEENHADTSIIGSSEAPYINSLANSGALFTESYGTHHPSLPNYLALFSGSNQGVTDDSCPPPGSPYATDNLGAQLIAAGKTFVGYSETLSAAGSAECSNGGGPGYQRKHNPWVDFSNVPAESNQPFTSFPADFDKLPTVSFVVPNQQHDMHDGTINEGDEWLAANIDSYAQWAQTHNSLLIVTWDEDDFVDDNKIVTIFVGQQVKPGTYGETINHYNLLRTIEDIFGLPSVANSTTATPITDCWRP